MIAKVKFIEMILDNYQGGSGNPIVRSILIELSDNTEINQIENNVLDILTKKGIRGTYNAKDINYPYEKLISIELLPKFNQ